MSNNLEEYNFPIQRNYDDETWDEVRTKFQNLVPSIMIDSDMTSSDIKMTISKIDRLLPIALMINSYIKTDFENIENKHKSLLKSLIYENKIRSRRSDNHKRFTDSEAEGRAYKVLREGEKKKVSTGPGEEDYKIVLKNPNQPTVETLRETYNERYNFMYSIVASLRSKKDMLITYGSMIKMESDI